MADSESSDVLANLPAGRPTRRSARRAPAGAGDPSTPAASPAPQAKKAAAKKPAAKKAVAKKAAPKTAAAKTAAVAKAAPAKGAATPAKAAPAAKRAAVAKKAAPAKKAAAKRAAAKKAPAGKASPKPVPVAATTAGETPARATTQRRSRIATPPEGRRADYTGGATHRARKVTTNRPWLPSSGFVLPEDKVPNQLTAALGGLGSALADVARLGLGVASSLTVRKREIEAPEAELTED